SWASTGVAHAGHVSRLRPGSCVKLKGAFPSRNGSWLAATASIRRNSSRIPGLPAAARSTKASLSSAEQSNAPSKISRMRRYRCCAGLRSCDDSAIRQWILVSEGVNDGLDTADTAAGARALPAGVPHAVRVPMEDAPKSLEISQLLTQWRLGDD